MFYHMGKQEHIKKILLQTALYSIVPTVPWGLKQNF
jgi:hypothetical protein